MLMAARLQRYCAGTNAVEALGTSCPLILPSAIGLMPPVPHVLAVVPVGMSCFPLYVLSFGCTHRIWLRFRKSDHFVSSNVVVQGFATGLYLGALPRGFASGPCLGALPRGPPLGLCLEGLASGSYLGVPPRGLASGFRLGVLPRGLQMDA